MSKFSTRTVAAQIIYAVIYQKTNLNEAYQKRFNRPNIQEKIPQIKALCFTCIRHYLTMQDRWQQAVNKMPKDKMVRVILTQAMAEFIHMDKPKHAVVNEAINTAKKLKKQWAVGLINATLRKAVEHTNFKPTNAPSKWAHPQWWVDILSKDWPNDWQDILTANNRKPPLSIRANQSPAETITTDNHPFIKEAYGIKPQDITALPAFQAGTVSVQDASAQLAALILDPQDGEAILDACAAPGGKTCHLLTLNSNIQLDAVELFPNRAKKIHENLKRCQHKANVIVADTNHHSEWATKKYHKILLDAPCSASGIVRRHVDIKFVRQLEDLEKICRDQLLLLNSAAQLLEANGRLLYVTCSVFEQENSGQINTFLKSHPEFSEIKLDYPFARQSQHGIQILSGHLDMDGFYYCYLQKNH